MDLADAEAACDSDPDDADEDTTGSDGAAALLVSPLPLLPFPPLFPLVLVSRRSIMRSDEHGWDGDGIGG